MKTIPCKKRIVFLVSYAAMTSGYILRGSLFPEYRHFVFMAWHAITAVIWTLLAIRIIALWIKLQKTGKSFRRKGKT